MDSTVKWKWLTFLFSLSTFIFMFLCVSIWIIKDKELDTFSASYGTCPAEEPEDSGTWDTMTQSHGTVLDTLSKDEINLVVDYLHDKMDLKHPKNAQIDQSFIHAIEVHTPRKREVLDFWDNNGPKPKREAKVFIMHGDRSPPFIGEYIVGPLPNITYAEIINTTARTTKVPYIYRPFSSFEFMAIYKHVIGRVAREAHQVLVESYNATPFNCGNQCLRFSMTPISSGYLPEGTRKSWFWFAHNVEFYTLHPLDFQFLVDMTSSDPKQWRILDVWYANQLFESLSVFLKAYSCQQINKTRIPFPTGEESTFSSLEMRENQFPENGRRPPRQFYPDGPRFEVNGNSIKYMTWDLKYKMSTTNGLQLFDIKFDSERIIYELSMQEVTVLYSGFSPTNRMLYYADSAGLFGTRSRGLVPSVDCPENAQFIHSYLYSANENGHRTYENAFCVFEHNANYPLRRHRAYGRSGAFYGGMVNSVLVVRTIMSVINYDYVFDYMFYQNGMVEIRVLLTGYLGTSFYVPQEEPYGAHVRKTVIAGLHNHLFNFKVDLDIKGTKNIFETLDIKSENKTDPWYGNPHVQNSYVRNIRRTEKDAAYKYNFDTPKYLLVSNSKKHTPQNVRRSYRIKPSGMSKLLLPENYGFSRSISWARYQVAITKQKDWEESSSSIFTMWDAKKPVVNFQSYIDDNDNIEDEVIFIVLYKKLMDESNSINFDINEMNY